MSRIVTDIYSLLWLKGSMERFNGDYDELNMSEIGHTIQNIVLCEKIYVEGEQAKEWGVIDTCQEFEGVFEILNLSDKQSSGTNEIIKRLRSSLNRSRVSYTTAEQAGDSFVSRSFEYAVLAKSLKAYLALHPERTFAINNLSNGDSQLSAAEIIIKRLDNKMHNSTACELVGANITVPPVAEHVIAFAKFNNLSLIDAIMVIRSNKNAQAFRKRCYEIDQVMLDVSPRSAVSEMQKLVEDIDSVASIWTNDINEGVQYVKRTISLSKVWGLGSLLESTGLSKITVKDPILWNKTPDLLFLNGLYKPPGVVTNT